MRWVETFTGKKFDIDNPLICMVDIIDIAHSLSMQCRFNGHTKTFYSVAEHSVHLSRQISQEGALCGLLHDASETYTGDIVKPIKNRAFGRLEDRILPVIMGAFDVRVRRIDVKRIIREIKEADLRMMATEKAQLMPSEHAYECLEGVKPYDLELEGWNPTKANDEFLKRFMELTDLAANGPS